ncbi:MAG: DUF4980 domain-containing protein [Muribaculaceae bacterium]|nr:DUF4980 domain-containing protein [Muribaculaceae bacterium]
MVSASEIIKVEHISPSNSLIRVNADQGEYILLPVQEGAPMSHIRVLADGRLDETLNIMLAENKIDYFVPLKLKGRDGDNVLLDIRCDAGRSSMRDAKDGIWTKEIIVSDEFDTTNREKYRPLYHHTPLYGWMNDPNGMVYKDGVWHLSYQWNPYGSKWENMTWGHSTSKDLIHWESHQPSVDRDALGAIFSGSAAIDKTNSTGFGENSIVAMYTSADASQTQSLAHSSDGGYTFEKYPGNPVIAYDRESRDPNFFRDEANNRWVLLLASALDHEMLIFTSPDMKTWTLESKFGRGYGSQDGVWECPDLMELPVYKLNGEPTGKKKWVLICNINPGGPFGGSAAQYFVGDFDGKTFTSESAPEVTKWIDYGKDYYAAVSFSDAPDNRHTIIGWMSNWQYANDVPTKQFRSANSLPRDLSLFEGREGQTYLASVPSPEVDLIRGKAIKYGKSGLSKKGKNYMLPAQNDGVCEIVISVEPKDENPVEIKLSNKAGENVVMTIDPKADTFSMDRTKSGLTDFSEHFPCVTTAPAYSADTKKYDIRIFIDRSSIEAFSSDGHFAMTNLVFPNSPYTTLTVSSPASGKINDLKIYPVKY